MILPTYLYTCAFSPPPKRPPTTNTNNSNNNSTMSLPSVLLIISFLPLALSLQATTLQTQSNFLSLMKDSLLGPTMARWDFTDAVGDSPYCSFSGISCDEHGYVVEIDLSSWKLAGELPSGVCSSLPMLRVLRLADNDISNSFPEDLLNCSFLEELNFSHSGLTGAVPDLSQLQSLRVIDLSNNFFTGGFPISIINLTNLEVVNFNQNPGFDLWRLPQTITQLKKLKVLILSTTSMQGEIPPWIGNMTSLIDLELSGNNLVGQIPATIGKLENLQLLELYYNQLSGEIPDELGNLTRLVDLDMSENHLTGRIPEKLCAISGLEVLQLYSNRLIGRVPRELGNSTVLSILSLYGNFLTGELPPDLGRHSKLIVLDVSDNQLSGQLPQYACSGGELLYLLVLNNHFTGELPETYAQCNSILRFRVSNNQLNSSIPEGIFGLPHAWIIDLGFNHFGGTIAKTIGNAKNLSALFLTHNLISGALPPEISWATNLVKIDLSHNLLSGPIPSELANLYKLNQLSLQENKLDSSIPVSLSLLKSLNVLNLSNNYLTGEIPDSLCNLLPNSLDFSNNRLSGPVPLPLIKEGLIESVYGNSELCVPFHLSMVKPSLPLCPKPGIRKGLNNIWVIGVCLMVSILAVLLILKRWFSKKNVVIEQDGLSSPPSFMYDVTSFHKLSFDQHEIVEALMENNIVGHGGSGTVYRIALSCGEQVAVKKLWGRATKNPSPNQLYLDKELKTEVETLGSIRHKNIVKLYCCFSSMDCKLLVYEYMPNGNLLDALHNGGSFLDWPTRHRIASGIAQGLAYLHHDLLFPIVHRDIKSSNILLDEDFEPKVADFGIAKVLQARGDRESSASVIIGTYGYLAPVSFRSKYLESWLVFLDNLLIANDSNVMTEYAYSPKATTKCDVYSFGVVLMELVTGKKPNEPEFGENQDIVHWVSSKMGTKEGAMDAIDKKLSWSPFKEDMIQVMRIALRCTCRSPALRPSMNEVVQLLNEVDPSKFDVTGSFKFKHLAGIKG
ncbi:receptor protein-tyrosine kinase CEPR1 [Cocos nucifera]|uniref:non-specific serine/threonine protein kinase n=1 Tax=Cocos nucifera TaxID=13894 RepID=A0A8K0IDV5_COCNU|nr:receptor protein-tyrosine kinase CEPR1 [Cocos nucifera]